MMCTATRPPVNWSSVASWRAATRRSGEAGAVGDHEVQALGHRGGVGDDQLAFRRGRAEGDQGAVEAAFVMGDGDGLDIVAVDDRAGGRMDLGLMLSADDADEFDGHGEAPIWYRGRVSKMRRR
jgi:hypothetical protein